MPWKLIPFLIVVLGVDNMFVLTQSVSSTSINMPVKERIAEGLSQSGVSIFLNLLAELVGLWMLYVGIPTRVIREMVVFGAVALVVDWIMEMTYFITVLSVDMQRLELADFIHQGSRSPPKITLMSINKARKVPRLAESIFRSVSERKARTYTAVLVSVHVLQSLCMAAYRYISSSVPIGFCIYYGAQTILFLLSARISTLTRVPG